MISIGLIYLWGISDDIIGTCSFTGTLLIVGSLITRIICSLEGDDIPKWTTKLLIAGIVAVTVAMFMPTRDTILAMQVAKLATKENYNWTVEQLKGLVDYISQTVKSFSN